ncbi:MAG: hypothetical protein ACREBW_08535, partial [Candidatus Micrarchaeaceae archaeon]
SHIAHPSFHPLEESTPAAARARMFLGSSGVRHPFIALLSAAADEMLKDGAAEMIKQMKPTFNRTLRNVYDEYAQILGRTAMHPSIPLDQAILARIRHDYKIWDPANRMTPFASPKITTLESGLFAGTRKAEKVAKGEDTTLEDPNEINLLPTHIHVAAKEMMGGNGPRADSTMLKAYDASIHMFKTSLLTLSPRFLSHILLGGLTQQLMKYPFSLRYFNQALKIIREGRMPTGISRHNLDEWSTDSVYNFAVGTKLGNWLKEHWHERAGQRYDSVALRVQHAALLQRKFYAGITDMQRTMVYLAAARKGDLSPAQSVNKTFADIDALTPFERQVMQRMIPFYAFQKHVVRYMMTFAVDHPIRVAVLSQMANQSVNDWNTGLPQKMMLLFDLGVPNPTTGVIHTLDVRSINPFRSMGNYFTLSGIANALNPFVQAGIQAFGGLDNLNQKPLYPQLSFSQYYGSNQSSNPVAQQVLQSVEDFIPQTSELDYFFNLTANTRAIKSTDPSGYRSMVFEQLGIPFIPNKYNVYQLQAKTEIDRYKVAEQDVANALATGDFSRLMRYPDTVPYAGYSVMPAYLKALYEQSRGLIPGLAGTSVITPPKHPKL